MTSPEWEAANEDDSDRFPQTSHASAPESTESHEQGSRVVPDPARVARYAEAIAAQQLSDHPHGFRDVAAAVVAVADEEHAALVADVERLREDADHTSCVEAYTALLARAEAAEAKVAKVEALELGPAERMALTVARAQITRGEEPSPNVAAVCVMALDRLRAVLADAPAEQREPECDMTEDGKHADGGIDPDWNEQICAACNDDYEPAEGDGRG